MVLRGAVGQFHYKRLSFGSCYFEKEIFLLFRRYALVPQRCLTWICLFARMNFFSQTFLSFEFFSCGKDQTLLIYESFNIIFHMRRSSLQNINPDFGYNEHSNLLSAILFWLFVLLRMFYTFMLSEDDLLMILFLLLQSSQVVLPWSNWYVCLYISFWFQQYLCNQESRWNAVYGKSHIPDTGLVTWGHGKENIFCRLWTQLDVWNKYETSPGGLADSIPLIK